MTYTLDASVQSPNFYTPEQCLEHYGISRSVGGITIHWWGDPATNPTLEGVRAELCKPGVGKSAHEIIEAGRISQIVDHGNAAWHAGNAIGNARTIGLECNPRASDEDYATIAERIRDLNTQYGTILPLYPHKHWYNTACPGVYDLDRLAAMVGALGTSPSSTPVIPVNNPAPSVDGRAFQSAIRTTPDNVWGPDTNKRWGALLAASNYGGVHFPYGVPFTQSVVGAETDGIWGPLSRAAHDATVKAVQRAVGAGVDGIVGPETVGKVNTLHTAMPHTV